MNFLNRIVNFLPGGKSETEKPTKKDEKSHLCPSCLISYENSRFQGPYAIKSVLANWERKFLRNYNFPKELSHLVFLFLIHNDRNEKVIKCSTYFCLIDMKTVFKPEVVNGIVKRLNEHYGIKVFGCDCNGYDDIFRFHINMKDIPNKYLNDPIGLISLTRVSHSVSMNKYYRNNELREEICIEVDPKFNSKSLV